MDASWIPFWLVAELVPPPAVDRACVRDSDS
jgi:hypothetical protein